MLRTIIQKKTAVNAVIVCVLAILLLTIWPMRRYHEEHSFSSGLDPVMISETVSEEADAGEYFYAQYDHLQTLEFYVNSVLSGSQALVQVFKVGENSAMELIAEETADLPDTVPGFAAISADVDLEPGSLYVYTVRGVNGSTFTVGFESAEDAGATGNAALYELAFYNDSGINGVALKTRLTYRIALTKTPSLLLGLLYCLLAVAALGLSELYFKLFPGRNTLLSVHRVLKVVLTPVFAILFGAAFLAVWPLKLFDGRILDILVYETGIVIAAFIVFYGLWHDRTGLPDGIQREKLSKNIWHYAIIVCIALIMSCSADYMNATTDLVHDASMHRIVVLLSLMILFMGDAASNLNVATLLGAGISAVLGTVYYILCRYPASEAEYAAKNTVLFTRVLAIIALTAAALSVFMALTRQRQKKEEKPSPACRGLLVPVLLLSLLMLVFMNTRLWIPLMIGVWGLFYLRFRGSCLRFHFLTDLCWGILLDFVCKVAYTMLHRYYMAYRFSRFSMHFHTPTVTAYYLVIVVAAAMTLFLHALCSTRGLLFKERLKRTWKQALLFGLAGSYMMMSLTRSGIGTFVVELLIGALYMGFAGKKEEGKKERFLKKLKKSAGTLAVMAGTVLLLFPATFTAQRIISTVYARPERFEDLETYDDWLVRNVEWNCTRFMNVEIFIRDFGDRIIGGEIGSSLYYGQGWNEPQGNRTANADKAYTELGMVASLQEGGGLLLTDTLTQADLEEASMETGDISNGRLGLYLAYLKNLNLTGHDEMGVTLTSGEVTLHAHNIFLQTAYDNGFFAGILLLVLLLSLFVHALYYAIRKKGKDPAALLPLLLVSGFLIVGMVEWVFHFCNPFTIAVLFSMAPLLFPDKSGVDE